MEKYKTCIKIFSNITIFKLPLNNNPLKNSNIKRERNKRKIIENKFGLKNLKNLI
jgi:hypothetical protein